MRFLASRFSGVLLLIVALSCESSVFAQTQEDSYWVYRNFRATLDDLMPLRTSGGFSVAYRSVRDLYTNVLEYSFTIGHEPNKKGGGLQRYLSAHVRMAD